VKNLSNLKKGSQFDDPEEQNLGKKEWKVFKINAKEKERLKGKGGKYELATRKAKKGGLILIGGRSDGKEFEKAIGNSKTHEHNAGVKNEYGEL